MSADARTLLLITASSPAIQRVRRSRVLNFQQITMPYLAAFVPPHWTVLHVDEAVEAVAQECASFHGKVIILWDDNLAGDIEYAKELFRALAPQWKWWSSQTSIHAAFCMARRYPGPCSQGVSRLIPELRVTELQMMFRGEESSDRRMINNIRTWGEGDGQCC
jgi:hypothetical protein